MRVSATVRIMTQRNRPRWVHWPFRVGMSAAALLLFDQAVFAGQFLAGSFSALNTHRDNAPIAAICVLVAALCAVPLRWPGGGPWWPLPACVGLFVLTGVQIALGHARVLTVHVPLGVTIILLASLLVIWAWRYRPASSEADREADEAVAKVGARHDVH